MKKVLYMNPMLGTAIIVAVLLVTKFVVFRAMEADTKNNVVVVQDAKQEGYELQPGYAKIEASRSKIIADGKEKGWYNSFNILAWIIPFAMFAWIRFFGDQEKDGSVWPLVLIALAWFLTSFLPTAVLSTSVEYETKICLKEYQEGKNYDHLFPDTTDQQQSLGDFLKSCR